MTPTTVTAIVLSNTAKLKQILQNKADFFLTFTPKTEHKFISNNNNKESSNNSCRFLILDSSFNPPTKAHSSLLTHTLASYPKNYFNASILLFSTNNADKKLIGASVLQRAQMMEILARQWDERGSPVYVGLTTQARFIDKSAAIQKWFQQVQNNNNRRQLELYFILGYDTITRFMDAKYYIPLKVEDALIPFFESCYLICYDRPGFNNNNKDDNGHDHDGKKFWDLPQVQHYINKIKQIPVPDKSISRLSSTLARNLIADQKYSELNNVLDKEIIQYLLEEKLYQL